MGDSRLAQLNRGSSGDQGVGGGPCRSRRERLVSGEHVPDRLGELAGHLHPSDLGAALLAEPGAGALVVVAVDGMAGGVGGGLDQRPAQPGWAVLGERATVVAAGRTGTPWDTPRVEPHSRLGEGNRAMSPISAAMV
jgi:hypothetical protein